LISNAGVLSPNGRIHNLADEDWERAFQVNLMGAVNGIRVSGDTFLDRASTPAKLGSVGRPCLHLDLEVWDEQGHPRLKDMIVSGGENVADSEVECVLYEHPAVLEVAVVGRPDERWGEVPVAFAVLRDATAATAEELIRHCSENLARFKVPKDVTFLHALPRNPSGSVKVLKRELRDES
jgi:acyl-CoA synthetase (AMP-forming)/AMP-acid ligase II